MALVGVELETFVSEPDAPTTRPPPCAFVCRKFLSRYVTLFSILGCGLTKIVFVPLHGRAELIIAIAGYHEINL